MNQAPSHEMTFHTIAEGKAMIQLIEAADILLAYSTGSLDTLLLRIARSVYQRRLRRWVATLPDAATAELLVASESRGDGKAPIAHP